MLFRLIVLFRFIHALRHDYGAALERMMGIEPTRPAWEAGVLPLNYTRMLHRQLSFSLKSTNYLSFKTIVLYKYESAS